MSHSISEAPATTGGLMEDLINIFIKPSAVFEHNRNKSFVMPAVVQMLLWLVLVLALRNLMQPFTDAEFARGMAKAAQKAAANGQPMPAGAADIAEKFKNVGTFVFPLVAPWLNAIVGGMLIWLAGKIFGAQTSYGQSATISAWSYMPALLATITTAVFGVLLNAENVRGMADGQLGPARFIDPATSPPMVLALLQRLDVFAIWGVILTGIGISVVGRVSRLSGMLAAIAQWAIVALILGGMASANG